MICGMLCYYHWEAMLISYLAKRVVAVPFSNMHELYKSDYRLTTLPGSAYSDSFKNGNQLWQQIFDEKLELFEEMKDQTDFLNWVLDDAKNAVYHHYDLLS